MFPPRIVISTQCEFCGSVHKHNFDFLDLDVKTHKVSYTKTCKKCYKIAVLTSGTYQYRLMTTNGDNWLQFVDYYSPINFN